MISRRGDGGIWIILLVIIILAVVAFAVYLYFTGQNANCNLQIINGSIGGNCGVHK